MKKLLNRLVEAIKFRTSKFFRKEVPEIPYEEKRAILKEMKDKYRLNVFIETGTFFGGTVDYFKNDFKKIFSVELSEELANKAIDRFKNDDHIQILQGNSGELLAEILGEINEPALVWLDGHYSSEFFVGEEWISTAKGEKNTPILNELHLLMESENKNVILIDDARLFIGENDYPTIETVGNLIKSYARAYRFYVSSDIIHILPL